MGNDLFRARFAIASLACLICILFVLGCYIARLSIPFYAPQAVQELGVGFQPDDFATYKISENLSFLPREVTQVLVLKQNIKRVGNAFPSEAGVLKTQQFRAPEYLAVPVLGGDPQSVHMLEMPEIYISCVDDGRRMNLLRAPSEGWFLSVVHVPPGWCPSKVEIVGISRDSRIQVGVGSPFAVTWLYWLLTTPLGAALATFLAFVILSIMLAPLLSFGSFTLWYRLFVAAAYPSIIGYGTYCLFWLISDHAGRMFIASLFVFGPLLSLTLYTCISKSEVDTRSLRLFVVGMACVALLCLLPYLLIPLRNGFWYSGYAFFPASWSTDNLLSVMMARSLLQLGAGHPEFLGHWSISDRGIVQAGTFSAAFGLPWLGAIFLSSPINVMISNMYGCLIQGLPLPLAILFFNSLRWSPYRTAAGAIIIGASPFFIFNSFYIWPKLYGGMFVVIGIVAVWVALRHCSAKALCVAIAAYLFASMNHSSNLLAVPSFLLYLACALIAGHHSWGEVHALLKRGWIAAVISVLLMTVALKTPEFLEPKSSWPILFLITGAGEFGLSSSQVHQRLLDFVQHIQPWQLFQARLLGLRDLIWITDPFYTRIQVWPSLRFARAVEEFSLLPSLGPGLALIAFVQTWSWAKRRLAFVSIWPSETRVHHRERVAPLSAANGFLDRGEQPEGVHTVAMSHVDLSRTMTLTCMCCLINLVVLALLQGARPVLHQLPYGLVEAMILSLVVSSGSRAKLLHCGAFLQLAHASAVWYLGAWGFWHERLW